VRVYVIRHGETDSNALGIFQGQTDGMLTAEGIELARVTGEALRDVPFDAAYTSPLTRAVDTAGAVLESNCGTCKRAVVDRRLIEIDMGDYEGKRFRPGESEVDAELTRLFFEDPFAFPGFPNGEDARQVCVRTQEFLRELALADYGNVLVSTHGFALRAMLNGLYGNSNDFWQGHVPYNCSISVLESEGDGFRLVESDLVLYDPSRCVDRYALY